MQYLWFDMGVIGPTDRVEVSLSTQARVLLLDSTNYAAYQCGGRWQGQGGWVVRTPACLRPGYRAHWIAVVDLDGRGGQVSANARVLRGLAA